MEPVEPTLQALAALAREHLGLDADRDRVEMAQLAAVGLTVQAWRNTSLEDLHASDHPSGGFPDSQMMRFNIATFQLVSRHVTADAFDWPRLRAALTDPDRVLPGGITVGELAGGAFDLLAHDIRAALAAARSLERRAGTQYLIALLALRGGVSYKEWYGSPWWPDVVEMFIESLTDRASAAWRYDKYANTEPPAVRNRKTLAAILREAPQNLQEDAIHWCQVHGLSRHATFGGYAQWRSRRDPDWVDPSPWLRES